MGTDSLRKLNDGTVAQGVVLLAGDGEIVHPAPLLQQALIGNHQNFYPTKSRGFVFGKRTLIGNTYVDLWEGPTDTYVFPTSAMQMLVKSTSDEDAPGGTGIAGMLLHYLDANYVPKTALLEINGTTGVVTVPTDIFRVNGLHATGVGTNQEAVGVISLTNLAGTVTYALINPGENTARQCIFTVPAGVVGYINHWQQSSGSTGNHFCQIILDATCHDGVVYPGVFLVQDEAGSQNGGHTVDFPIPIPIPGKSDVKLRAISDASNANVTALGAIMGWFEQI